MVIPFGDGGGSLLSMKVRGTAGGGGTWTWLVGLASLVSEVLLSTVRYYVLLYYYDVLLLCCAAIVKIPRKSPRIFNPYLVGFQKKGSEHNFFVGKK